MIYLRLFTAFMKIGFTSFGGMSMIPVIMQEMKVNHWMTAEDLTGLTIMKKEELRYLQRLAELYPTIGKASTEIINLQSILNLPKGTEHFMSDLHGEYEAFSHVLRNGSGAVRKKIDDVFGHTLSNNDKRVLATLIYYPKEKIQLVKKTEEDMENWYKITLYRLIEVCKTTASKYTRSKVRKALPPDYAYVIEELITEKAEVLDKEAYYDSIVNTIIEIGRAENFIIALAELIQRLVVDHLHILGDIFDRGPGPHFIMDRLIQYHSLDIQWGNHDVVWMGAAVGQRACIATVLRNSIRYGNLDILEDGYGINMLPLATFAMEVYKDDPCTAFEMKGTSNYNALEKELGQKMHKAIAIIQFKLEGQLLRRHKEFHMEDRCLLHRINPEKGTVTLADGKEYPMVGAITGVCEKKERLIRFGYVTIEPEQGQEGLLRQGEQIRGHEFHYFDSTNNGCDCIAGKPVGKRSWTCIHADRSHFIGFPHLYYPSCPDFVINFVEQCRNWNRKRKGAK